MNSMRDRQQRNLEFSPQISGKSVWHSFKLNVAENEVSISLEAWPARPPTSLQTELLHLSAFRKKGVTVWGSFTSAPFVGTFNEGSLVGKMILALLEVLCSPRMLTCFPALAISPKLKKMLHKRKENPSNKNIDLGRPGSIHTTLSRPFCTRHYEARQLSAFCDATRHRKR